MMSTITDYCKIMEVHLYEVNKFKSYVENMISQYLQDSSAGSLIMPSFPTQFCILEPADTNFIWQASLIEYESA